MTAKTAVTFKEAEQQVRNERINRFISDQDKINITLNKPNFLLYDFETNEVLTKRAKGNPVEEVSALINAVSKYINYFNHETKGFEESAEAMIVFLDKFIADCNVAQKKGESDV